MILVKSSSWEDKWIGNITFKLNISAGLYIIMLEDNMSIATTITLNVALRGR
jgi:hypothetical protein